MESEQFSLCWNNFHTNLSTGFQSLLKDESLVDVTLAAEGKFLKAHKTVLSVCSPFFKELFRANPCKHPIVILPDINYDALCNVLHFMYQGEVSVSQEEIPIFMRVAETLKVKGLTDNKGRESGYDVSESNGFDENQRHIMKRPRPAKKLIKPVTHLRPLDGAGFPTTDVPIKRPHLLLNDHRDSGRKDDEEAKSSAIVTPKQEPKDVQDESVDIDIDSNEATHMTKRNSAMFDESTTEGNSMGSEGSIGLSTLATPSPSNHHQLYNDYKHMQESSPGLTLLKSGRGQLVLIHNGHIYTLLNKQDNRSYWVCVKKKTLQCEGCVTTLHGSVLLSYSGHNHPQMHDVIQRLQVPSCSISPELL